MDYSTLPKVDRVLEETAKQIIACRPSYSQRVLTVAVREAISFLRTECGQKAHEVHATHAVHTTPTVHTAPTKEALFAQAVKISLEKYQQKMRPSLQPVINATGVVLHTNLGRAPLAPSAAERVRDLAAGYCNLELNLDSGKRGSRYDHVRTLLCDLTGAEEALVVNNNAAAVMVTLDTLAKGGEAIVSRGQLVEIGGSFRIPDIIESSNATLKEVGSTNKTHLKDYENALTENTSCVLQVHPSNFHMTGFVEEVSTADLAKLAHAHNLPLIYDLGSGCLYPFAKEGVGREPLPPQIMAEGADVLTFSGDKLLGGAQSGIIVGKKKYLEPIMHNQMLRALRVDKMTLGALEATLELYRDGREKEIPTVAMLTATEKELKAKAETLQKALETMGAKAKVVEGMSPVGGGSMPDVELPGWVVEVEPQTSADDILTALRQQEPAVLAYVHEDKICFNTRTVAEGEMPVLIKAVKEVLA